MIDDYFLLEIFADGIGLPAGFDAETQNSFVMSSMQGLPLQVCGEFSITIKAAPLFVSVFKGVPVIVGDLSSADTKSLA